MYKSIIKYVLHYMWPYSHTATYTRNVSSTNMITIHYCSTIYVYMCIYVSVCIYLLLYKAEKPSVCLSVRLSAFLAR